MANLTTKPIIKIHDLELDQEIEREMTNEEYQFFLENNAQIKAAQDLEKSNAAKKSELLTKLGITAEEASLLLS
jgi:hypothetical protein